MILAWPWDAGTSALVVELVENASGLEISEQVSGGVHADVEQSPERLVRYETVLPHVLNNLLIDPIRPNAGDK